MPPSDAFDAEAVPGTGVTGRAAHCQAARPGTAACQHSAGHRTAGVPLHIRVGLNFGEVVVRSIGSDLRMDYTAVGQTTHLAARLEQMAMPGAILISAETLNLAEGYVVVKSLGERLVKGNDTKSGSSRREGGLTSFWRGTGVRFACWLAAASVLWTISSCSRPRVIARESS